MQHSSRPSTQNQEQINNTEMREPRRKSKDCTYYTPERLSILERIADVWLPQHDVCARDTDIYQEYACSHQGQRATTKQQLSGEHHAGLQK
jgi:hypothetical protein